MKLHEKVWTHWQWYKSLFSITILRYFVIWFSIVPIFATLLPKNSDGKIILKNIKYVSDSSLLTDPNTSGEFETEFFFNLALPFHWELLWASSLCFVIALILYSFFCPGFIKKYPSFKEYKSHYHSPRWIVWEALNIVKDKSEVSKFLNRLKTKKYVIEQNSESMESNGVIVKELFTELVFDYKSKVYSLAMPIIKNSRIDSSTTDEAEREIFWEIFGRYSTSKPFWRILIIFFLIISLILFSIPVIENIYKGSEFIYNSLFH